MSIEGYNPQIESKEQETKHEKAIISNTNTKLAENLDMDKEKIFKQIEAAKNAEDRVKLFAKRSDTFGLEALIGLFEEVGDVTPAIISTCYLLAEGIHIGLSRQDCLKILGYQTADVLIGAIPVIGDIADFFFKSNKYSAEIFSEHLEKLKKAAIEKGIPQEEIDNIGKKETRFIKTMNRYIDNKSKKEDKAIAA